MEISGESRQYLSKAIERFQNLEFTDSIYCKKAKGWDEILENRTSLSPEKLLDFLNEGSEIGEGISYDDQRENYLLALEKYRRIILKTRCDSINTLSEIYSENLLGEATYKISPSLKLSLCNLINAETLHVFMKAMRKYLKKSIGKSEHIKILEIGSGFGELCRQISKYSHLQKFEYHIVDIPENLMFAELYLGSVFGSESIKKPSFFDSSYFPKSKDSFEGKFYFHLPFEIEDITTEFDLVVNCYSMQEMNKNTAKAYVEYISNNLSTDGIFLSINAPYKKNAQWGISNYEDYGFPLLDCLESFMMREFNPSGANATVPIVNIFKKRSGDRILNDEDISLMNDIGYLQSYGFSKILEILNFGSISITNIGKNIRNLLKGEVSHSGDPILLIMVEILNQLREGKDPNDLKISQININKIQSSDYYSALSDHTLVKISEQATRRSEISKTYEKLMEYYLQPKKSFLSRIKQKLKKFF